MKVKPKQGGSHSRLSTNGLLQNRHDYVIDLRAWELIKLRIKTRIPSPKTPTMTRARIGDRESKGESGRREKSDQNERRNNFGTTHWSFCDLELCLVVGCSLVCLWLSINRHMCWMTKKPMLSKSTTLPTKSPRNTHSQQKLSQPGIERFPYFKLKMSGFIAHPYHHKLLLNWGDGLCLYLLFSKVPGPKSLRCYQFFQASIRGFVLVLIGLSFVSGWWIWSIGLVKVQWCM